MGREKENLNTEMGRKSIKVEERLSEVLVIYSGVWHQHQHSAALRFRRLLLFQKNYPIDY